MNAPVEFKRLGMTVGREEDVCHEERAPNVRVARPVEPCGMITSARERASMLMQSAEKSHGAESRAPPHLI